jgi:hypothetical protein
MAKADELPQRCQHLWAVSSAPSEVKKYKYKASPLYLALALLLALSTTSSKSHRQPLIPPYCNSVSPYDLPARLSFLLSLNSSIFVSVKYKTAMIQAAIIAALLLSAVASPHPAAEYVAPAEAVSHCVYLT